MPDREPHDSEDLACHGVGGGVGCAEDGPSQGEAGPVNHPSTVRRIERELGVKNVGYFRERDGGL